ncbi:MAG TPA: hypothetical protein VGH64_14440 [Puia sp.]|jgi:hypothetical protein
MHKPLLLLFSAGCLISCHKDASNPVNKWTWFGTQNSAVYNYVLINASQVLTKSDSEELHVGVSAAFIDSNNNRITYVQTLSVNDLVIQPGQDSMYNYNYGTDEISKGSQMFGTKILVTIHGNDEADTVSSSVYLPKQLSSSLEDYPDTVSISRGLPLQWLPDADNTWGNVVVQLFYYSALSRKADSTMPQNISTVNITVPDNGKYNLTQSDLRAFPRNAYIGITIARGMQNEAILPLSRKRVYYFSSASVSTPPVRVRQ